MRRHGQQKVGIGNVDFRELLLWILGIILYCIGKSLDLVMFVAWLQKEQKTFGKGDWHG